MKKHTLFPFICIILAVMLFAAVGCSQTETPATDTPATDDAADMPSSDAGDQKEPAEGEHIVGFLEKNEVDPFHVTMNTRVIELLDQAVADGIISDYKYLDGDTDPVKQVEQMETLLGMGCTDFIVCCSEAEGCMPMIELAAEAGANLVNVNALAGNIDDYPEFAYVEPNYFYGSSLAANAVIEARPEGGGYCVLKGIAGNSSAGQKAAGHIETMDAAGNWELLDEQHADWDPELSIQFTTDWLSLYGDKLNAILCGNDTMAVAAAGVCIANGRDDILVTGGDALEAAADMIANGEMFGTIWDDPEWQAEKSVEVLLQMIKGEELETNYFEVESFFLTIDNIGDWYDAKGIDNPLES